MTSENLEEVIPRVLSAEKTWQGHRPRGWPDRVAHIDIDMEDDLRRCQRTLERHPGAAVLVLSAVADGFDRCSIGDERKAIRQIDGGDLLDESEDCLVVVRHTSALEVHVSSRSPHIVGGEEDSALEDELGGMARGGQAVEEPLQDVELEQLVGWAVLASGLGPQREVHAPGQGGLGGSGRSHRRISRVSRKTRRVRGKAAAILRMDAGWDPRLRSHRRRASRPISAPSNERIRKASMMQRSGE